MASRGVCCAAQAAGDLGRPLIVTIHKKDGTTQQRCGVCEVQPSCRNPQKLVFAFRFLKSMACGLPGTSSCQPTQAGIAQYNAERTQAASVGQQPFFETPLPGGGATFRPGVGRGTVYQLPLS